MTNRIRHAWDAGRCAVAGWLQIPSALSAEALATCGFDGLVVDLQHSPIDIAMAGAMFTAIEGRGTEPMARAASLDAAEIGKLLDTGAYGIIAPMVETRAHAQALADAVHYPPDGARSYGPRRPLFRYGPSYADMARETLVVLAMIETRRGLDNLDDILTVEGLDGVFIGPSDLALALGEAPAPDSRSPIVTEAVGHIRARAQAHGRRCGVFCGAPDFAAEKVAEGFDLVTVAPDLGLLTQGARQALEVLSAGCAL